VEYPYTWKCPNETSCRAILNKQKHLFTKMNRKIKHVLSGGWQEKEGRGYKERVEEDKHSENIICSCMKMEK
jgi:hypothetical protein